MHDNNILNHSFMFSAAHSKCYIKPLEGEDMPQKWKQAVIQNKATIREAIKAIDAGGFKLCIVVDNNNTLVGVVSDGDIRRGLLNNVTLEDDIHKVINKKPMICNVNHIASFDVKKAHALQLRAIPVVDDMNQLVSLKLIDEIENRYDNPIFISAGGFGKRLLPYTKDCPKPMLKVGDYPIIEHIIRKFKTYGFHIFYISIHYKGDVIKNYLGDGSALGVSIEYIEETAPLGTAGALSLLNHQDIHLPLITVNADILTGANFEELLSFHSKNKADLTVAVREYDFQVPFGVVEGDDEKIIAIVEKPVHKFFVSAGFYIISPEVIKRLEREKYLDMPDLVNRCVKSGDRVIKFPLFESWIDIGRVDEYMKVVDGNYQL